MVDLVELRRKRQIERLLAVRKAEKDKATELRAKGARARAAQDAACARELQKVFEQQQEETVGSLEARAASVATRQGEAHRNAVATRRDLHEAAVGGAKTWAARGDIHDACHAKSLSAVHDGIARQDTRRAEKTALREGVRAQEDTRASLAVTQQRKREQRDRELDAAAQERAAVTPRSGLYQVRPAGGAGGSHRADDFRHTGYHKMLTPAGQARQATAAERVPGPRGAPAPPGSRFIPVHAARGERHEPTTIATAAASASASGAGGGLPGLAVHFPTPSDGHGVSVWKNAVRKPEPAAAGDTAGDGDDDEFAYPPEPNAMDAAKEAAAAAREAREAEAARVKAFRQREQQRATEVKKTWEQEEEEKEALRAMRAQDQAERKERIQQLADEARFVEYQQVETRRSIQLRAAMNKEFERTFARPDLGWRLGDDDIPATSAVERARPQAIDDTAVVQATSEQQLYAKALTSAEVSQHLRELFELSKTAAPPKAKTPLPVYVPPGATPTPTTTATTTMATSVTTTDESRHLNTQQSTQLTHLQTHDDGAGCGASSTVTVVRYAHPAAPAAAVEEANARRTSPPKVAYVTRVPRESLLAAEHTSEALPSPSASASSSVGDGEHGEPHADGAMPVRDAAAHSDTVSAALRETREAEEESAAVSGAAALTAADVADATDGDGGDRTGADGTAVLTTPPRHVPSAATSTTPPPPAAGDTGLVTPSNSTTTAPSPAPALMVRPTAAGPAAVDVSTAAAGDASSPVGSNVDGGLGLSPAAYAAAGTPFAATANKMANLQSDIQTLQDRLKKLLALPTPGEADMGAGDTTAPPDAAPAPGAVGEERNANEVWASALAPATAAGVPDVAPAAPVRGTADINTAGAVGAAAATAADLDAQQPVTPRALAARIRDLVGTAAVDLLKAGGAGTVPAAAVLRTADGGKAAPVRKTVNPRHGSPTIVAATRQPRSQSASHSPVGPTRPAAQHARTPLAQQSCNVKDVPPGHGGGVDKVGAGGDTAAAAAAAAVVKAAATVAAVRGGGTAAGATTTTTTKVTFEEEAAAVRHTAKLLVGTAAASQQQQQQQPAKGILRVRALPDGDPAGVATPHADDSGDDLSLELSRLAAAAAAGGVPSLESSVSTLPSSTDLSSDDFNPPPPAPGAPGAWSSSADMSESLGVGAGGGAAGALGSEFDTTLSGDTSTTMHVDTSLPFDAAFLTRNARLWETRSPPRAAAGTAE